MRQTIEESVQVEAPVSTTYNHYTRFEDFPEFMDGVKEVQQLDDRHLHWKANVGGEDLEWDAEITEQIPDKRIAWRNRSGPTSGGVITFHRIADGVTRVMLQTDYEPEGVPEKIGSYLGVLDHRVRKDLERFRERVERLGDTAGWRRSIPSKEDLPA